ncbi:unnamed protein product [Cunninghamella blakesleeana]
MEESIIPTTISHSNNNNNNTNNNSDIPKSTPVKTTTTHMDITDSDESDIDLDKNSSYFANLNVSDKLKNILRYKDLDKSDDSENSDNQNESLLHTSILKSPKNIHPVPPSIHNNDNNNDINKKNENENIISNSNIPTITSATKTRLPVLDQEPEDRASRFQQLLSKIMVSDNSSSDDDNDTELSASKSGKKDTTKKSKSKKKSELNDNMMGDGIKSSDGDVDDEAVDHDVASVLQKSKKGNKHRKNKNETRSTLALLDDSSDDEDNDDYNNNMPKKLSKKAQIEMYREDQRLKRSAEVKLRPIINRKTIDDLIKKVEMADLEQDDEEKVERENKEESLREASSKRDKQLLEILRSGGDHNMDNDKIALDDNVHSNTDDSQDSDDSLIIVGKPGTRGDKLIKSALTTMVSPVKSPWRKMMNMTTSPLNQHHYSPINPFSMQSNNNSNNKNKKQPLDLKTLNKQLLDKIGKEQLSYRQEMIEKAKSIGIYMTPEERARKVLERENEAALLDLEVQKLLLQKSQRKAGQNNLKKNKIDAEGDILLSGEEDEEEYEDSDIAGNNSNSEDDEEIDHDLESLNGSIQNDTPEPTNSITKFFKVKTANDNKPKGVTTSENSLGPKLLNRLMQRSEINNQDEEKNQQSIDDADDEDTNDTGDDLIKDNINQSNENDGSDSDSPFADKINIKQSTKISKPKEYNEYFEEEAEEEDDEYFGMGGPDIAETDDLDHYEQDGMLVEKSDEHVDASQLQAEYNRNVMESDQNMVQRLIKDITSGGLRRKRAAAAAGLLLDDYDLFDDFNDDDNDLTAIRLREAFKRKKLLKGDPLQHLASNPKTAAFAKAAMNLPVTLDLSDDDKEEEENNSMVTNSLKLIDNDNRIKINNINDYDHNDM